MKKAAERRDETLFFDPRFPLHYHPKGDMQKSEDTDVGVEIDGGPVA